MGAPGRTDAWIAHQLDVSVGDIRGFKREPARPARPAGEAFVPGTEADEPDLRAEDDALVAEALEAERQAEAEVEEDTADEGDEGGDDEGDDDRPKRAGAVAAEDEAAPGPQAEGARGHLRPRRGGLRALARPGGPG